ncbi:MAG: hypothetical protein JSR62_13240 [Nitrospira sp.]|nr:hypothetical protein [Nitrospira sp.]
MKSVPAEKARAGGGVHGPHNIGAVACTTQKIHTCLVNKLHGTWIHHLFHACRNLKQRVMRQSEGENILLQQYVSLYGKPLNLTSPQTFTEKLFCRMISWNRGHDPIFTRLSDKYTARDYVLSMVGEQYLPRLLWSGTDPNAIPFDTLPVEYVIKTNHASGQVIVVTGQVDRLEVISKLSIWLESNFYWVCREYQYYHIEPRVMIEEYLSTQDDCGLLNYKFWCFGGVPEVIHISNSVSTIHSFFDVQWNHLDLSYREDTPRPVIAKPINFEQMLFIASQLSAGFDFVRVDLYNVDGKIYFGELTFTPMAGVLKFRPVSWDLELGQKWKWSA